jgi:DNA-binding Lrp family transcriptional regulator
MSLDRRIVQSLQGGMPLVPRPYDAVAEAIGVAPEIVRERVAAMLADGRIRRIGAVLRHRRLGYEANAMVVWDVPDERLGGIAPALARDAAVTLCYRRARAAPDWPYNLYCMVHGRDRAEVEGKVAEIATVLADAARARDVLYSTRILKKTGLRIAST